MRGLYKLVLVGLVGLVGLVVAGCGGPSDPPPGPLARHFDDMHIARIPLEQKQAVVTTQNDWAVAKMENANAEANTQEADSQLHQARNDHRASRLAVDSAIAAKKAAEQSADMNRINSAQKDLRAAEDSSKAAEARVKYFEQWRAYLKRYHRYTQENMYFREAQYENAKAQLAKTNNIQPKGVNYDWFPKQAEERDRRTQKAKQAAEGEKGKTLDARQRWLSAQQAADKLTGRTGALFDPMDQKSGPTTAGGGISQDAKSDVKPISQPTQPIGPSPTPTPAPDSTGGGDGGEDTTSETP
jgi:hypothetical protein